MNKTKVTQQQYDNIVDALTVMWPSVPPKNVMRALWWWRNGDGSEIPTCGTVACFGGWCAIWPAFAAQGVRPGLNGRPTLDECESAKHVAGRLFGNDALFDSRTSTGIDLGARPNCTDHELVTHRLKTWLAQVEVAK